MELKFKKTINYFWLVGLVFLAHHFSSFLENKVMAGESFAWVYLFLWYFAFLSIGDTLIKYFLKWRD